MATAASKTKVLDSKLVKLCGGYSALPGLKVVTYTWVYANTYATGGGDACDLSADFPNNLFMVILPPLDDTGTVTPRYDYSAKKMKAYIQNASDVYAELGAADASTYTFRFMAIGN